MNNIAYNTLYSRSAYLNKLLALFTLFLLIIPIGVIPGTIVAPINYLSILLSIKLILSIKIIFNRLNRDLIIILLCFFIYFISCSYFNYLKNGFYLDILKNYRFFIIFLFFLLVDNKKTLFFLLKSTMYLILFSGIFGLLIYMFGEPFASIRMFILDPSNTGDIIYVGKGDRIVGFYNKIFHYGYLISILPMLLLTFYKINSDKKYIFFIILSFLGIILNGERATLLASVVLFMFLYNRFYSIQRTTGFIILISTISYLILSNLINLDEILFTEVLILRTDNEFLLRIARQIAGVQSVLISPFTGSYQSDYIDIYYNWFNQIPRSPHNAYINIGMKAGFLGWFLFLVFIFRLRKLLKNLKITIKEIMNI